MKRHLTTATMRHRGRGAPPVAGAGSDQPHPGFAISRRPQPDRGEHAGELKGVRALEHTLVLTGELHHRSAHIVEEQIERICADGVTDITLDLRELTYIDSIGIAVIAFRWGLCRRRGYALTVIPGSRFVQRALEQAGVTDLLPLDGGAVATRDPHRHSPDMAPADAGRDAPLLGGQSAS
jgi:anti-sigma B factor antagonist